GDVEVVGPGRSALADVVAAGGHRLLLRTRPTRGRSGWKATVSHRHEGPAGTGRPGRDRLSSSHGTADLTSPTSDEGAMSHIGDKKSRGIADFLSSFGPENGLPR